MNDRFHYDALVDDALRSVVRRVLTQVADKGLPGSHHFYISFRSTDPGVQLPEYLRAKYPDEMTIVLQHQYWDLIVHEDFFEVTVSFNKQQERIKVPFSALSAFVDPSVRFGLQFDRKDKAGGPVDKAEPVPPTPLSAPERRPQLGGQDSEASEGATGEAKAESAGQDAAEGKPEDPASKIVKLDSFRKK
ncbi:SspB family protein [Reyranella sp.]|jgi:hypothetical protein|uniref:SspB family protein n=1 Tax=Reyranella sp. TaxID=1929291 RepID=UPI002F938FCC